jgi:hypothetical protein
VSRDRSADANQLIKQGIGTLAAAAARLRIGGERFTDTLGLMHGDAEVGPVLRSSVAAFGSNSARKSRALGIRPLPGAA